MKHRGLLCRLAMVLFPILLLQGIVVAQTVKVYGYLLDEQTGYELPFAAFGFTNQQTKVTSGGVSNLYGKFEAHLPAGSYRLTVNFVGYIPHEQAGIEVKQTDTAVFLGKIVMKPDATILSGATVRGEREDMRLDVDKKVFSVENSAMTVGGTATDVLNQIPTIDVDMDGNVSLRGSSDVLIYINGKPSGFSGADKQAVLQQIPAANIERVEIITNPSAKYDAEGTSGIINIILKTSVRKGWNANLNAGVGTNNKYNASASFSYNRNKFKLTATYGLRYNERWDRGNTDRFNFFEDTSFLLNQNAKGGRLSLNNTLNGVLDYQVTGKTTLSLNWLGGTDSRNRPEDVFYSFSDLDQTSSIDYFRNGKEKRNGLNGEAGFTVTHNFDNKGHNLLFLTNVSHSSNLENADFKQDETGLFRQVQSTRNGTKNTLPVVQLDYTRPASNETIWETGAKFTMRRIDDDFYSDTFNFSTENYDTHEGLTNNFLYNEAVSAAYINYSRPFSWFKVKAGVRAEQTFINGEQKANGTLIENNYLNFFPSLFLTKEVKKGHEAQLSYSRRINRPHIRSLNPFAEQTDPFNLRTGNPALNPELIDAVEATYFVSGQGNYITGTLYYRQINGVVQRIRSVNEAGVATMTYANLDVSRNVGLEGIVRRRFKNLNTTLNLNLFRNQVSGTALNTDMSAINYSWFGKLLVSYKLFKTWDIQASYQYRGKITYVQGTIEPMHNLDLGFRKDVLKNKGTITLNVTDVFNTRQFAIRNTGMNFESDMVRKWESRVLTVNFTYKLGNTNPDWNRKPQRSVPASDGGDFDF